MKTNSLRRIEAAVPLTAMPASMPASIAAAMGWPAGWTIASPLERLVAARLFGRAADRNAIAAAWDEAQALGLTMQALIDALPDSELRRRAKEKLAYVNRRGT